MKQVKRRLLSVVMALAILCTLVPSALAYNTWEDQWNSSQGSITIGLGMAGATTLSIPGVGGGGGVMDPFVSANWSSSGPVTVSPAFDGRSATVTGTAVGTGTVQVTAQYILYPTQTYTWTVNVTGTGYPGGGTGMYYTSLSQGSMYLQVGGSNSLTVTPNSSLYTISNVQWSSSNPSVVSVTSNGYDLRTATVSAYGNGSAQITAVVTGYYGYQWQTFTETLACNVTAGTGAGTGSGVVTLSSNNLQMNYNSQQILSVTAINGGSPLGASVTWTTSDPSVVSFSGYGISTATGNTVTLYSGAKAGQATITATVSTGVGGQTYTAQCLVNVGNTFNVTATVSSGETGFTLGSTNMKTTTSVVNQIASALYSSVVGSYRTLSHVIFGSVTSTYGSLNATAGTAYYYGGSLYYGNLENITFVPSSYNYTGSATFSFTAYDTLGGAYPGTLTITVEKGGSNLDVAYSATLGQTVQLNAQDFSDFWQKETGNLGTLRYVTFGNSSSTVGRLYYTATNGQQVAVPGSTVQFYVSPNYTQTSLGSVSFVPSKMGVSYRTGTLAVPFTAYGTTSAVSAAVTSRSGMMYIMVTDGAVEDISYQAPATGMKLDGSDFLTVYRKATNSTLATTAMYIQLLDVPAYGTLYYGSGSYLTSGTKLTTANIGSMLFSSNTGATNSISNITYIPGTTKAADTVRYVAYSTSNGTPLYVGEINFGATAKGAIKYHTNSAGVTFKTTDFFNADTGLLSVQYITFGKPSSGTLYKNYSNGKGTAVSTTDLFSYSNSGSQVTSINNLTYVPAAGYTGVVSIPYTGSNITGTQVSGTVKVYVVSKAFKDVPTTLWSYEYVTELTASGIVNGVTPTTFYPNSDVKYGEALKLIMLAAGYSEQAKTGSHWASGYLTRAYRDGLVTNPNIDLNATVDRNTIASIAAKALKLSPVTNITSPFVDSNDGYVLALYQAGIVEGTTNGGRTYYYGTSTIKRGEICAIICRINDYNQ